MCFSGWENQITVIKIVLRDRMFITNIWDSVYISISLLHSPEVRISIVLTVIPGGGANGVQLSATKNTLDSIPAQAAGKSQLQDSVSVMEHSVPPEGIEAISFLTYWVVWASFQPPADWPGCVPLNHRGSPLAVVENAIAFEVRLGRLWEKSGRCVRTVGIALSVILK